MNKVKVRYKTKKIVINDFSKFNLKSKSQSDQVDCGTIYNMVARQGVLKRGLGIRKLTTYFSNDKTSNLYNIDYSVLELEHFNKVMYFKQYFARTNETAHRLLIHGSDGKLYLFEMFQGLLSPNWVYLLEFSEEPEVLNYKKDGLDSILISANDKLVVWSTNLTPYELSNVPTITSMCVYNDVLYCTIAGETDKIWYTKNLNPESVGIESDETGFLTLEGSAGGGKKIVVLDENVYVFCDYGIGRVNTYAKEKPTYNQIYLTNGRIYPKTVAVGGDVAMFMTDDGLYRFNGTAVTKIDVLDNLLLDSKKDNAVGAILNDDYYLALNINFDDGYTIYCEHFDCINNAVIKLNMLDNKFDLSRGIDIKNMLPLKAGVEQKMILTFNGQEKAEIGEFTEGSGNFFNKIINKFYATNYIVDKDMQPMTIRKIVIDTKKDETIKIVTDNGEKEFKTYQQGVNKFDTIIPCNKFKIEILMEDKDPYVNNVQIEYIIKNN